MKSGRMDSCVEAQTRTNGFKFIIETIKAVFLRAAHQRRRSEIRQAKFLIRIKQTSSIDISINRNGWTVEVGAAQDRDAVRQNFAMNILRSG